MCDSSIAPSSKLIQEASVGIEAGDVEEGVRSTKAYKAFTKSNYRYYLKIRTGLEGEGMDAHHMFPQARKFKDFFSYAGINIHDPKNISWWERTEHQLASKAYHQ